MANLESEKLHKLITDAHRALPYVKDSHHYLIDKGEAWGIAEDLEEALKAYEIPCTNQFCKNGKIEGEHGDIGNCITCNGKGTLSCPQ